MTRRPDDLLPLLDAAALVDRSLSTLRAWVRAGELASYREGDASNGRVLLSRAELLTLAAAGGLSPSPGRRPSPAVAPAPSPPAVAPVDARLLDELLLSHRATVAALDARCSDLAAAADTWRGRAEAAESEAAALRGLLRDEAGRPLWSRLFGLTRRPGLPGDGE
jgi:hypothetical protein